MGLARWLCLVLMLSGLARSGGPAGPLPQDAYVWQRRWTPALEEALRVSSDMIGRWRVLAAERDGAGGMARTAPDWGAVARSGRPAVLVVRIGGSTPPPVDPAFLAEIGRAVDSATGQGVRVAGIEIDHDCATARLDGYALFLEALRRQLPPGLPLSITALPTWLPSPLFGAVAGRVDEIVLQVHAVRNPRFGLFDPRSARMWLDQLARRTGTPFRVALPAYGVRVRWGADGRLAGVEGERPTLDGDGPADDQRASELAADPAEVAGLLRGLERNPPPGLRGVVWFRLPTAEDGRAWSLATWRAVMRGASLRTALSVEARDGGAPGLRDLVLVNAGAIDADLPRTVLLGAGCALADGVGGYALRREGARPALVRVQGGTLRGGQARVIGWMRCGANTGVIDVQP